MDKNDEITKDPSVIEARRQAAIDLYKKHNPNMDIADINNHIKGIDFTKSIEIIKIPPSGLGSKGNELYQFTKTNSEGKVLKGDYYSDNPSNTPNDLGVSDKYNVRDPNNGWKQTDEIATVNQEKIIFDESKPVEGLKSSSSGYNTEI